MTTDQTVDAVVLILVIGLIVLGLGSMFVGWIVNRYWPSNSTEDQQTATDEQTPQTNTADGAVCEADPWIERMQVDRTRAAVIELMVYTGWSTSQIRAVLKGDSAVIGTEVEAARQRLGMAPSERVLRVRDAHGERVIPL